MTLVKTAACIAWPTCPTAASGLHPPNAHYCHQLQTTAFGSVAKRRSTPVCLRLWFSTFVLFILGEGVSAHTMLSLAASKLGAQHRWCVVMLCCHPVSWQAPNATAWALFRLFYFPRTSYDFCDFQETSNCHCARYEYCPIGYFYRKFIQRNSHVLQGPFWSVALHAVKLQFVPKCLSHFRPEPPFSPRYIYINK